MNGETRNISVILRDNESLVEENQALKQQLRLFQENCSLRAATVFASLLSWLDSDKTRTTQTEVAVRKLEDALKSFPAKDLPDIRIKPPTPAAPLPSNSSAAGRQRAGSSRPSPIPSPAPVTRDNNEASSLQEVSSLQEAYENWASYKKKENIDPNTSKSQRKENSLEKTDKKSNVSKSQKPGNGPSRNTEENGVDEVRLNQSSKGNYSRDTQITKEQLRRPSVVPHFVQNYSDGCETESLSDTSSGDDDPNVPREWCMHGHVWTPNMQQPTDNRLSTSKPKPVSPPQPSIADPLPPRTLWKDVLSPEFKERTVPSPKANNDTTTSIVEGEYSLLPPVRNVRSKSPNTLQLGVRGKEAGGKTNRQNNTTPTLGPNVNTNASIAQRENFIPSSVDKVRSKSPTALQPSVREEVGVKYNQQENIHVDDVWSNSTNTLQLGVRAKETGEKSIFIPSAVENVRSKSPNTLQFGVREERDRTGDIKSVKKGSQGQQDASGVNDTNTQHFTSKNNEKRKHNPHIYNRKVEYSEKDKIYSQDTGFQSHDNTRQTDDLSVGYRHVGFPVASSTPHKKGQGSALGKSQPGLPSPSVRDRTSDVSYWGQTVQERIFNEEREAIRHFLNNAKPNKRLIGEVAYQLDRRILNYVFSIQGEDHHQRKRFYGFTLQNIKDMIIQESVDRNNGEYDTSTEARLTYRLEYILLSLSVYGYSMRKHAIISADLVNRYGLLPIPSSPALASLFNIKNRDIISECLEEVTPTSDLDNVMLLFDCLSLLAQDEQKPLFIW